MERTTDSGSTTSTIGDNITGVLAMAAAVITTWLQAPAVAFIVAAGLLVTMWRRARGQGRQGEQ